MSNNEELQRTVEEMEALREKTMQEEKVFRTLQLALIESTKKIVVQVCPEVYQLEPEGYLALEDVVWRSSAALADKIGEVLKNHSNGH